MREFSEKVQYHRAAQNLSQKQLAQKAGVTERTIASYERGERFPHAAQLYKLAKALGVSTEYLKDESIDDPAYGLDRMEYVEEMRKREGNKESLDLEKMLQQNQALFAGGTVSEEAKDAYFQALMKAYLECKESARQTFGHKKSAASEQ